MWDEPCTNTTWLSFDAAILIYNTWALPIKKSFKVRSCVTICLVQDIAGVKDVIPVTYPSFQQTQTFENWRGFKN